MTPGVRDTRLRESWGGRANRTGVGDEEVEVFSAEVIHPHRDDTPLDKPLVVWGSGCTVGGVEATARSEGDDPLLVGGDYSSRQRRPLPSLHPTPTPPERDDPWVPGVGAARVPAWRSSGRPPCPRPVVTPTSGPTTPGVWEPDLVRSLLGKDR